MRFLAVGGTLKGNFANTVQYDMTRYAADKYEFWHHSTKVMTLSADHRLSFDQLYFWLYAPTGNICDERTLILQGRIL